MKTETQETTLRIQTIEKPNGFRVVVGLKKGSGTFNYIIGTKEQAQELGEKMKERNELLFKHQKEVVSIEPCFVSKCSNSFCNKLTEEVMCLRCEDIMYEAQCEAREQEQEYEVLCNGY